MVDLKRSIRNTLRLSCMKLVDSDLSLNVLRYFKDGLLMRYTLGVIEGNKY